MNLLLVELTEKQYNSLLLKNYLFHVNFKIMHTH